MISPGKARLNQYLAAKQVTLKWLIRIGRRFEALFWATRILYEREIYFSDPKRKFIAKKFLLLIATNQPN